ncbi:hypothetical protein WJX84_009422 [Apatococcus fuscideae]|uniref:Uncharacterized protein n=1 Tax=Apatococcus fuscideae TaxID=2026836 RepID=A0AAW1SSW1_9CHLO
MSAAVTPMAWPSRDGAGKPVQVVKPRLLFSTLSHFQGSLGPINNLGNDLLLMLDFTSLAEARSQEWNGME